MKKGIHPNYNQQTQVTCSCGNTFAVGSVMDTMQVDICSKCHPFFTGEMKFVDRQGRVDKFMKKMQAAQAKKQAKQSKTQADDAQAEDSKSYKDILRAQQTELKKAEKQAKTAKASE